MHVLYDLLFVFIKKMCNYENVVYGNKKQEVGRPKRPVIG
jgi:hypothetical protein